MIRLLFIFLTVISHSRDVPNNYLNLQSALTANIDNSLPLEIWHYPLALNDTQMIANAIDSGGLAEGINLPHCELNDLTVAPILNALCRRSDLKNLDLRYNQLGASSLDKLALIALNNPLIESLNLSGNGFYSEALCHVLFNLKHTKNLKDLNLQGVPLSQKTSRSLSQVLPLLDSLRVLNLTFTQVPLDLRQELLRSITSITNLEILSLSYNNWDGCGNDIVEIIRTNPKIKVIDLRQSTLTSTDFSVISSAKRIQPLSKWFSKKMPPPDPVKVLL